VTAILTVEPSLGDEAVTFEDLQQLTEAEAWFEALGVQFDPAALASIRLAVLKNFGLELKSIAARLGATDEEKLAGARIALAHAYDTLRRRSPEAKRILLGGPDPAAPLVQLGRPRG
jgi:hypothetical protein